MTRDDPAVGAARGTAGLDLDPTISAMLRARLPEVAEKTVAAVTAEVPGYAGALSGEMGANIEQAVQTALGGFLRLAEQSKDSDASTPLRPALEAAYALGRGEARSGRTMDALLAAYRVGARVSWRELSGSLVDSGLPAATLAQFAELVFAYIDGLSAASVAGHADELATTGRVRQRHLERLGLHLLSGASADVLTSSAEQAGWPLPDTLTAVLLPSAQVRAVVSLLDPRTLEVSGDLVGVEVGEESTVLLVPDVSGSGRAHLLRVVQGRHAVVGPSRRWTEAAASYRRTVRAHRLVAPDGPEPVDTEEHLVALVLGADPEALQDLRARVLAPLSTLRSGSAERMAETLRSWLLHQGRRDDVAADLLVHPQTVRYRMTQLRELYGERLNDPRTALELIVALAVPVAGPPASPSP
jgi:hypothetical protein